MKYAIGVLTFFALLFGCTRELISNDAVSRPDDGLGDFSCTWIFPPPRDLGTWAGYAGEYDRTDFATLNGQPITITILRIPMSDEQLQHLHGDGHVSIFGPSRFNVDVRAFYLNRTDSASVATYANLHCLEAK